MAEFGVVGLSVMGGSLAKNLRDHGVDTAVYSVDAAERDAFRGGSFAVADTLADFCAALSRPRRILMMIYAGAVDSFLGEILPYLEAGDILIDGGNSNYADTERRIALAAERGVRFVGMGVSGGEEGARHGPSLMVGCDEAAWAELSPILCKIAARAEDGTVCCGRVGSGGAGHLTKTVHNGIEYGEMQVIAELCHIMRIGGLPSQTIGQRFALWNRGLLQGYLTEIAAAVLSYEEDGQPLVDRISDVARQKNTGKWASQEALALGCPAPSLFEAVAARLLTEDSMRAQREALYAPARKIILRYIEGHMERAYLAAKTLLYVQGLELLRASSEQHGWGISLATALSLWKGGCIIRSALLPALIQAVEEGGDLLSAQPVREILAQSIPSLRKVVSAAAEGGAPVPAMGSALAYFDAQTCGKLPGNVIQGLRDCFGAHGYERIDREGSFHTKWLG